MGESKTASQKKLFFFIFFFLIHKSEENFRIWNICFKATEEDLRVLEYIYEHF